jgi:hypothetical protein
MEKISKTVINAVQPKEETKMDKSNEPPPESDCNLIANSNRCVILRTEGGCVAGIKTLKYVANCSGKSHRACGKCRCNSVEKECKRRWKKEGDRKC